MTVSCSSVRSTASGLRFFGGGSERWFVVWLWIEWPRFASFWKLSHVPLKPGLGAPFGFTPPVTTNHVALMPSSLVRLIHHSWSGAQLSSIVIAQAAKRSSCQRQTSASPGAAGHTRSFGTAKRPAEVEGYGSVSSCRSSADGRSFGVAAAHDRMVAEAATKNSLFTMVGIVSHRPRFSQ